MIFTKKFYNICTVAYWEVFCEALLDSLKTLPILLAVYFLIELVEHKWAHKLQNNHLLRGQASPVLGALVGSVPQCGFSVVATDLFARGIIPIGTLLAIFVATSDEALPILLTHPGRWLSVVILLVAKIVIAILVGYVANLVFRFIYRRPAVMPVLAAEEHDHEHEHDHDHTQATEAEVATTNKEIDVKEQVEANSPKHLQVLHGGCCHHHVDSKRFNWLHPFLHSLKILAFIFVVNFLFGCITDVWVGEENLKTFLGGSLWLQPLLSVLVGLIPNCAASVVLTEFYLVGGLRFGALLGGLCVNAGLGIIFMLRHKKMWQEKLFVIGWLIGVSLLAGYSFLWLTI